jgi:cytochrome-b5 reductase
MATSSPWRFRARKLPPFAVAVFIGAAGVMYLASSRPSSLRDARTSSPNGHKTGQEVTNTLSFPKNMLFAQNLIVSKVEQVNHDTKKITFTLPGGDGEVCGVPDGGVCLFYSTVIHLIDNSNRRNSYPTHSSRTPFPSTAALLTHQ